MAPKTTATYKYNPLRLGEVRILHLQPGDTDDSIRVDISHEQLRDARPYRALSWQWGVEKLQYPIRVMDMPVASSSSTRGEDGEAAHTLLVNKNLLLALKCIRHNNKVVRLWVDAICIDQIEKGDERTKQQMKNSEKSEQVKLMTKIFGDADEVNVWLGEEEDDSDRAFDFVHEVIRVDDSNYIASLERRINDNYKKLGDGIRPFINLLKRGWFSRRWVVQEIAVAQKATLFCGSKSVSWDDLANAVTLLEKVARDGTINRVLKKDELTNHVPEYFGTISSLPAYRLVQTTTGIFRAVHGRDRARSWRFTLEELVCYLAAFKSKRLHDTIYAVLGLASDFSLPENNPQPENGLQQGLRTITRTPTAVTMGRGQKSILEVNYDRNPLEVYKLFLNRVIEKSRSLDILNRPWAPESGFDASDRPDSITLPSWIASLSRKPFQEAENGNMFRFNPDPLVGPVRNRFYAASGNEEADIHIDTLPAPDGRSTMTVRGFIIDKITETYNASSFGAVPGDWLKAGGWVKEEDGSIPPPPDALWRTLVADRDNEGHVPARWYPMVFQSVAKERGLAYGFETYRLIHESTNAWIAELFRRVQAVVWGRKLIYTEGKYIEYLSGKLVHGIGLAPKDAEKGDLVCIILGCSVPLVLRREDDVVHHNPFFEKRPGVEHKGSGIHNVEETEPTTARSSSGRVPEMEKDEKNEGTYRLMGECYIDHMMDGEALAFLEENSTKEVHEQLRLFTLV